MHTFLKGGENRRIYFAGVFLYMCVAGMLLFTGDVYAAGIPPLGETHLTPRSVFSVFFSGFQLSAFQGYMSPTKQVREEKNSTGVDTDLPYDHFLATYTGTLFLVDAEKERMYEKKIQECQRAFVKEMCWRALVVRTNLQEGGEEAFGLVTHLSNTEPSFPTHCSAILTYLGADAYQRFLSGDTFFATIKTKYCGYAYFQGFLYALEAHGRTPDAIGFFCRRFNAELTSQEKQLSSCFHGFGQAELFRRWKYVPDRAHVQKQVEKSLSLCTGIGEEREVAQCQGGVFNSLASLVRSGDVHADRAEPLALCDENDVSLRLPCYRMFKYILLDAGNGHLKEAVHFIENKEETLAQGAVFDLASLAVRSYLGGGDGDVPLEDMCATLPLSLRRACVQGAVSGLMVHGKPGEEYVDALRYCAHVHGRASEKTGCYTQALWIASSRYSPDTRRIICEMLPTESTLSQREFVCL